MTEPGFVHDLDEQTYHRHAGSLSVTGAKTLLKAPALFKWQQDHPVYKDVFDIGSAAHKLVLGVGDEITVIEADDWRTKAAKEAREAARAEGKIPLLKADHEAVKAMADKLSEHTLAMRLLSEGQPEVSAFAVDPDTGVMRRGRFDWLGATILTDYKTAACAEPRAFRDSVARYGYDMQAAWYLDLARDLDHPAEAFAFIVQEKTAPYLVEVIDLDDLFLDRGRTRNRNALERFRDCTESGIWPGYTPNDQHTTISPPRWALYEEDSA